MFKSFFTKQLSITVIIITVLLMILPLNIKAAGTNQPVTQYMLVDRSTSDGVLLRNYSKVASLLKQIGFKVSKTEKGMEPVCFTITATRPSQNGGTTRIKYSGNDMYSNCICIINFANKQEFDYFVKTLDGTGWTKRGNSYFLGTSRDLVTVVATLNGNTITLVEKSR